MKKTLEELLEALRVADVDLEYQGEDRRLRCVQTRLVQGGWETKEPWADDWKDARLATDAEVAHALAAVLLRVAREAEANANHLALGQAAAKVLASSSLPPTAMGTTTAA